MTNILERTAKRTLTTQTRREKFGEYGRDSYWLERIPQRKWLDWITLDKPRTHPFSADNLLTYQITHRISGLSSCSSGRTSGYLTAVSPDFKPRVFNLLDITDPIPKYDCLHATIHLKIQKTFIFYKHWKMYVRYPIFIYISKIILFYTYKYFILCILM